MYDTSSRHRTDGTGTQMGVSPTPPTREISDAHEELGKEIASLHEILNNLESRLSPVLKPTPSTSGDSAGAPGTGIPMADILRGYSYGIAQARWRIAALLENIAL